MSKSQSLAMPEEDKAQNRYHAADNTEYQAALRELQEKQQQKPSYAGSYDNLVEESFGKLHNRQPFSYDPGSDLLYQQYRDQYLSGGRRAMSDTVAKAAALTGGYGSSYAAALGQQQYGQYVQQLNERLPELYDRAYTRYLDQGEGLLSTYREALGLQQGEYGQYQDALALWQQELTNLRQQAGDAWDRGFESWQAGVQNTAAAHERLRELIGLSGYIPSDEDLQRAGMSRQEAEGYLRAWQMLNPDLALRAGEMTEEDYYVLTGIRPGGGGGGVYYGGSGKKKEKEDKGPDPFGIVDRRAQIERDYNAGRIDYDDREQLVNALYGW